MEKQKILERQQQILDLVGEFCTKRLDSDYFELSKNLTLKLGRKRNVPFITGQPKVWAAAIIHALGTINFLFDKSFYNNMGPDPISRHGLDTPTKLTTFHCFKLKVFNFLTTSKMI